MFAFRSRRRNMLRLVLAASTALVPAAGPVLDSTPAGASTTSTTSVTTTVVDVAADTFVRADAPTANYGTAVRYSVQGESGYRRAAYLRFKPSVPAGSVIRSVLLRAYGEPSSVTTGGADLYTTSGAWTEHGVTWNNAPARGTWLGKKPVAPSTWSQWDLTSLFRTGPTQLDLRLETTDRGWRGFQAREATGTQSAQLVITTESAAVVTGPDGVQAATSRGWGAPVAGDEFDYVGAPNPTKWNVYNSPGHAGNGVRSPRQVAVDGAKVTITGTPDGTTGGMSANFDRRKYGRWEARMKVNHRDPEYHPVLILWPDAAVWPCGGEIDYAEGTGDTTKMKFFQHYSCENRQTYAVKSVDATQWHNYAVEWTDKGIVGYLDGVEWFRDSDPTHLPPGSMHQTIQLDWFPDGTSTTTSTMDVDWVRVYDL